MAIIIIFIVVIVILMEKAAQNAKIAEYNEKSKSQGWGAPQDLHRQNEIYADVLRQVNEGSIKIPDEYAEYFKHVKEARVDYIYALALAKLKEEGLSPYERGYSFDINHYDPIQNFKDMYAKSLEVFHRTGDVLDYCGEIVKVNYDYKKPLADGETDATNDEITEEK